jgi:imidazolonepropionase-like amidohydrolase
VKARGWLFAALAALAAAGARAETLVIDGEIVHRVSGKPIAQGRVVVRDGRIAAVGAAPAVPAPEGARRLHAAVVTPGLIDAHTSLGLSGPLNVLGDQDQNETSDANQADLRALDAFHPEDALLRFALKHGVVLVQTGPGPATPIAGQAGIFRTSGASADAMALRAPSALVLNLGEGPKEAFGAGGREPTSRMGAAALLRRALLGGREHAAARARARNAAAHAEEGPKPPDRDLKQEALARVASGELPALFVAHRADDILTALRIAKEFNLRFAIAGATEGWLVADALRDAGAPVLVGPVMERPGALQTLNASYENPARLAEAGVRIAIRSGYESYVPKNRLVLFEAAIAAANGLGQDAALRAVTLGAAEVLGIDDRHGSLESGKAGDLVLFDGDPFEYTSHVTAVVAGGEIVHERR